MNNAKHLEQLKVRYLWLLERQVSVHLPVYRTCRALILAHQGDEVSLQARLAEHGVTVR